MGTGVTGHLAWGGQRAGPLPFDSRSAYLFGAPELRKDSNVWGLAFPGYTAMEAGPTLGPWVMAASQPDLGGARG